VSFQPGWFGGRAGGGNPITVGFEDKTGGGNRDYQDVVLSISRVDVV